MGSRPTDLRRLLEPTSIAVIGASPDQKRFGGRPLHNLLLHGFPGTIFPVNPKYREIRDLRCYRNLREIRGPIDCALIAVPGDSVPQALADCVAKRVKLAVVLSSGFAEAGLGGKVAQETLAGLARSADVRILGPNCLGFVNVPGRVAAAATGVLEQPALREGPISFVSQSGAMGFVAFFNRAYDAGVGFRFLVATGNESDLHAGHFLEYYVEDPGTRVVTALIEGFRDPTGLRRTASRAAELGKPIVVLKSGRSEEGARAASAHTAALAGSDAVHDAIFKHDGIIRVDDIDELWQVADFLASCSLPSGPRVAVISSSGGFNGILADHLRDNGLVLPALSDATIGRLGEILPPFAYLGNPIDVTGQFAGQVDEADRFIEVMDAVDADPQVDLIVLVQIVVRREFDHVIQPILRAMRRLSKPSVVVAPGGGISAQGLRKAKGGGLPIFDSARSTARTLGLVNAYADWRRKYSVPVRRKNERAAKPPIVLTDGVLPFAASVDLLSRFGIPMVDQVLVTDVTAARDAAGRMGYPVVLKAVGTALMHKADIGAVRLSVQLRDIGNAFSQVARAGRSAGGIAGYEGVVVQRQIAGIELIVGIHKDQQFGPMLAIGAGGTLAELISDVALCPTPVTAVDARALLEHLKVNRLLRGFRGASAADVHSLVALLLRLSELATCVENLETLDLNPVIVGAGGSGSSVVDVLIVGHALGERSSKSAVARPADAE